MQLVTFQNNGRWALGVALPAGVVDVALAAEILGLPAPASVAELIAGGAPARLALNLLVERAAENPSLLLPMASLHYGPCVPQPGKIICIGLNYRRHAAESGMAVPKTPVLFSKFNNALTGHGHPVAIPPDTQQMDYEAELAVVIGRQCRHVAEADALDVVFGYCNANDISARDLQMATSQWLLGKTPDGFLPLGPLLVTAEEIPDPGALRITCTVNGELRQDSNTADLIFSVAQIISYLSRYITLDPGDIISTGTPAGVAMGRADKPWLRPGDVVTVAIDGLGTLTNQIVA
jgi:2-keto-4-pentenoate hydratase/2-oxohepta-3-ene-1,7-dioic acid hydratase in catechol pathway